MGLFGKKYTSDIVALNDKTFKDRFNELGAMFESWIAITKDPEILLAKDIPILERLVKGFKSSLRDALKKTAPYKVGSIKWLSNSDTYNSTNAKLLKIYTDNKKASKECKHTKYVRTLTKMNEDIYDVIIKFRRGYRKSLKEID